MKPGTLVMLVRYYNGCCHRAPPLGAVGEVLRGVMIEGALWYTVHFPKHLSSASDGAWGAHPTEIIPINDPDADVSDTLEAPITNLDMVGIK